MNQFRALRIKSNNKTPLLLLLGMFCFSACQKAPVPATPEPQSAPMPAEQPTGLVKNPVRQSHTADVTQWLDQVTDKTPAEIAREKQLAKEAKEKEIRDAKLALEAKALAAKAPPPAPAAPLTSSKVVAKAPETNTPLALAAPRSGTPAPTTVVDSNSLKVVSSVQPQFPRNAVRDEVSEGLVTARLYIETDGKVSKVEIIKANPTRYFDREVIAAAMQWRYAPIAKPQTANVEFKFKLDGNNSGTNTAAASPPPAPAIAAQHGTATANNGAASGNGNLDQIVLKVLSSVQPQFPRSAVRDEVSEGVVSARLHIEPNGSVSKVDIVKANPTSYFDKAVIAAASQWKYAPISRAQTTTVEFKFKLDK